MHKNYETGMMEMSWAIDQYDWSDKYAYACYLAQTYYFVQHSTRLLALAASRFSLQHNKLHYRYAEHISEESNHEKLALKDIEALGYQLKDFPELPTTRAFYQSQYYLIEHVDANAMLGYILALEGIAVTRGGALYEQICKVHGSKAGLFLKVHANEDEDHIKSAFAQFDQLSENEKNVVWESFRQSTNLYCHLIYGAKEFCERATSNKSKKVA